MYIICIYIIYIICTLILLMLAWNCFVLYFKLLLLK